MTVTRLQAIFQKNDTQMPRRPAPKIASLWTIVLPSKQIYSCHSYFEISRILAVSLKNLRTIVKEAKQRAVFKLTVATVYGVLIYT